MKHSLITRRLLLIYQMPKTGSQTVEATLQRCSLPHHIYRCHFLRPELTKNLKKAVTAGGKCDTWKSNAQRQLEMAATLSKVIKVRNFLRRFRINIPKIEVITGVREVISLALSSIFQNHSMFVPNLSGLTTETCRELLRRPKMFLTLENWFELELEATFGLNVYETHFPRQTGYAICENPYARVLIYRMESLHKLPAMLSEFLGCVVPEVVGRNLGHAKDYAHQYSSVKRQLRLPASFVAARYGTRLMQHFYSNRERAEFASLWIEREPGQREYEPAKLTSPSLSK